MSLPHFSHQHPLILRKEVDTTDGMLCYGCHQPILPPSAAGDGDVYICGDASCHDPFYLHKKCAEVPKEIQHRMHNPHPLTLISRPPYNTKWCVCNVCGREWGWFTYRCTSCEFDVCVSCAGVGDRSFKHVGHDGEHILTLMQRDAIFKCDACGTKAEDSSYACNSCEFWMHKTCALSPTTLEAADIHRHPLVLTYSLPLMHRNFTQKCRICQDKMHPIHWLYYCDECTYFAHIKCVAKRISFRPGEKDESKADPEKEVMENDDLVRFPVNSKESFIHIMIDHFTKWNFNSNINLEKGVSATDRYLQKRHEDLPLELVKELDGSSTSTGDHPQTLIKHWSHEEHHLELVGSVQVEEIICSGCVQPITPAAGHPFYGCIPCNFFLHKFCLMLPPKLPAGACSSHPQHPLILSREEYNFFCVGCTACKLVTNGFVYGCETCDDMVFDIRCCFLPKRIKHQSHNHPLLHSTPSDSECYACGYLCTDGEIFKCERMSCNFQIHQSCALLPDTMRHRWDPHPIRLIYPPLDHQGLIYCEICEDEIDTNDWLYHCCECDHSFHTYCLRPLHNAKLGDKHLIPGLHKHTLTFVVKKQQEHHGPFLCSACRDDLGSYTFVLECANCEELFCVYCVASNL